jgi:ribonuclease HII
MEPTTQIICGIDEVGRGPLAGPVMAAAVILPATLPAFFADVTDSKKLTAAKREKLFPLLMECCQVGIGQASVEEIDRINILQATFLAMQRAFDALLVRPDFAFVDGNRAPKLPCQIETVIGGDAKVPAIAAASIIAKVTRDRLMIKLCEEFPGYNWSSNAGYGSSEHMRGLTKLGPTVHHRKSFAPIRELLTDN